MDDRRDDRIFVKGELLFTEEPDWETLAVGLKRFRERQQGRICFARATSGETGFIVPFFMDSRTPYSRLRGDEREKLSPEESKVEFFSRLRESVDAFFGCPVEFTELFADFQHPDDLMLLEENMNHEREGGFFGPPNIITVEELRPKAVVTDELGPFEELDSLIGLESVKERVHELADLVKRCGKENLPCLHMVFRGNPGTGKTTVARAIAKIFDEVGVTNGEGKFVETDREGLVGQYVGHTAVKTKRVIKSAEGGTLFIDEAYSLALYDGERDFGAEALSTLVKELEDKRNEFVCILAGYPNEMTKLIDVNPGLRDRIGFYIDFPDYSAEELCDVFELFVQKNKLTLNKKARVELGHVMERVVAAKDHDFANARLVRRIFERVRMDHLLKVGGAKITAASIERVFEENDMALLVQKPSVSIGFCA